MKKICIIAAALLACGAAYAQDDVQKAAAEAAAAIANAPVEQEAVQKPVYWTKSAELDLGINQTSLTNWAAGGFNTVTLSTGLDAKANYAKDLMSWNNRLQLQYGFIWSQDKSDLIQKNNDRIYLESKWAYQTGKDSKWNYTASFDFRSQFTDTYNKYEKQETGRWEALDLKSGFISPAYTNIALGMEWKPNNWFNINIAPLTGGFTICQREMLRKSYGMHPVEGMEDVYRSALFQFGAQVKANAKFSINDALNYETQLVLFTDYLNHPFVWTRVNWDNKVTWQLAKNFKIGFNTWLIYDPIVMITQDSDIAQFPEGRQRIQFKEFLSFSFVYTFK